MIPSTPSSIRYPTPPLMPTDPLFHISTAIHNIRMAFRQLQAGGSSITSAVRKPLLEELGNLEAAIRQENTLDLDLLNEVIDLINEIEQAGTSTETYLDRQSDWTFKLGNLHEILGIFNSHPEYETPSKAKENEEVACYIDPTNIPLRKIYGTFGPMCSTFLLTKKPAGPNALSAAVSTWQSLLNSLPASPISLPSWITELSPFSFFPATDPSFISNLEETLSLNYKSSGFEGFCVLSCQDPLIERLAENSYLVILFLKPMQNS